MLRERREIIFVTAHSKYMTRYYHKNISGKNKDALATIY